MAFQNVQKMSRGPTRHAGMEEPAEGITRVSLCRAYFCVEQKNCVFGEIVDKKSMLTFISILLDRFLCFAAI